MAAFSGHSDTRKSDRRRVSCETLCSSNSSCVLQKRKPLHPLATSVRSRTSNNPVTQRVLSAKLLRFKTLQNQLNDANYHITQLVNENKTLKNLQKRQDHALSKYEGANAQLPQVLESHQEEIRALQIRNKNLRKSLKDVSDLLKNKDEEINTLKDQNKHLLALCKNKNLEERKELQEKVEDLEASIRQNESTISMLNRKLMLESKNYKFKLNSEVNKHKQTQRELQRALSQLQELSSRSEIRLQEPPRKPTNKLKSQSVLQLSETIKPINLKKAPTTDKITSNSLTHLNEDIKSSTSSLNSQGTNLLEAASITDISKSPEDLDSSSEAQLKEIVNSWQKKNSKVEDKVDEEMKKYANEIMNDVRFTNEKVDKHTNDYQNSLKDTEILLQSLKENDVKHDRLSKLNVTGDKMSFYDYTIMSSKSTNDDLMAHLLQNDKKNYSFEEDLLSETTSKSLTISEPEVDREDKKKLLAKLKAIDNGDSIVVTDLKKPKCDLMKELFGS